MNISNLRATLKLWDHKSDSYAWLDMIEKIGDPELEFYIFGVSTQRLISNKYGAQRERKKRTKTEKNDRTIELYTKLYHDLILRGLTEEAYTLASTLESKIKHEPLPPVISKRNKDHELKNSIYAYLITEKQFSDFDAHVIINGILEI